MKKHHPPRASALALAVACIVPPALGQAIQSADMPRMRVLGHAPSQAQAAAVEAEVARLLGLMSRDDKMSFVGGTGAWDLKPLPALGRPQIHGTDGGAGVRLSDPVGVNYPSGSVLSATWNVQLAQAVGAAMARDAKAGGFQNLPAPGMNIDRIAYAGRAAEYGSGEDPYLGAVLMPAVINGIQSEGVWATAKHLAVNDQETNRFHIDVKVDERTLREIYLPPFESAVKSGQPANLMCAFNKINGGYRGYDRSGKTPLYAFGHGLSYTQFSYANVAVATQPMTCSVGTTMAAASALPPWAALALPPLMVAGFGRRRRRLLPLLGAAACTLALASCSGGGGDGADTVTQVQADQLVQVSFDVTNTGSVAGAEVAQVYVAPQQPAVERPAKELKGFAKVSLAPGETKRLTVTLNPRAFAYYDVQHAA